MKSKYSDLLLTFLSEYNILVWNINKPFVSTTCSKILRFIKQLPQIINFLKSKLVATATLDDLCNSQQLWTDISQFLDITTIDNVDDYNIKISRSLMKI